jgi:hypothetical protein
VSAQTAWLASCVHTCTWSALPGAVPPPPHPPPVPPCAPHAHARTHIAYEVWLHVGVGGVDVQVQLGDLVVQVALVKARDVVQRQHRHPVPQRAQHARPHLGHRRPRAVLGRCVLRAGQRGVQRVQQRWPPAVAVCHVAQRERAKLRAKHLGHLRGLAAVRALLGARAHRLHVAVAGRAQAAVRAVASALQAAADAWRGGCGCGCCCQRRGSARRPQPVVRATGEGGMRGLLRRMGHAQTCTGASAGTIKPVCIYQAQPPPSFVDAPDAVRLLQLCAPQHVLLLALKQPTGGAAWLLLQCVCGCCFGAARAAATR